MIKIIDSELIPESMYNGPAIPDELFIYVEGDDEGNVPDEDKIEHLLKIEDFFGWDYVIKIPTGQLILTDRNSGFHTLISQQDFDQFLVDFDDDITEEEND